MPSREEGDALTQSPVTGLSARTLTRRQVLQAAGYAAAAAFLAACSSTPAATSSPTAAPGAGTSSGASPSTAAASTAPAASGGTATAANTIRVAEDITVESNQHWLPWHNFGQEYGLLWCAQRLVSTGADGTIAYDMAQSFDVSPDATTYTFHLRPGNKWHDGTPVTAADVAFTFNSMLKVDAGSTRSTVLPVVGADVVAKDNTKDASGIQVVDDNTIKFVFPAPNNSLFDPSGGAFAQTYIAPKHVFDGVALKDYVNQPIASVFIGSGPYKMVQSVPNQFVNLVANPDFILGTPGAAAVTIKLYANRDAAVLGIIAGDVDFMYLRAVNAATIAKFDQVASMDRLSQCCVANVSVDVNCGRPYLADPRIRQALLYALDRNALAKVVGPSVEPATVINDWTNRGLAPDLDPYNYDPAKAKQLLQAANFDASKVIEVKWQGPTTGLPELPFMLQAWNAIGVQTKAVQVQESEEIQLLYKDENYDLWVNLYNGQIGGSPWGTDLVNACADRYPAGYNPSGWCNQDFDNAYKAAVTATNKADVDANLAKASKVWNTNLPYLPYFERLDQAMVGKRLKGPKAADLMHPLGGNIAYWQWTITS